MRIVTVQFDREGDEFTRMLNVFRASSLRNIPNLTFQALVIEPPEISHPQWKWFDSNVAKLNAWADSMKTVSEPVIFADCDMLCLRDCDAHATLNTADICYTTRTSGPLPLNGGIIMAKPNDRARGFFEFWRQANNRMASEDGFHAQWRLKYSGINQSALGYVLEKVEHGAEVCSIPCRVFNAMKEDWHSAIPEARFVHVKGPLRDAVFGRTRDIGKPLLRQLEPLVKLWHDYEKLSALP